MVSGFFTRCSLLSPYKSRLDWRNVFTSWFRMKHMKKVNILTFELGEVRFEKTGRKREKRGSPPSLETQKKGIFCGKRPHLTRLERRV